MGEDFHSCLIRTPDFKRTLYSLLAPYGGKRLNLMVCGGSLLPLLDNEDLRSLQTGQWKVFFSDERCNPEALNSKDARPFLGCCTADVHPIDVSLGREAAAEGYQRVLARELPADAKMDLCLLGVGANGHICSLWPDSRELGSEKDVIGVEVDCPLSPERVTVTVSFLNRRVAGLYFVIPPKGGIPKGVAGPHPSISRLLSTNYTVILPC